MGKTKETNYTKKQVNLADYSRALAHPARIAILEYMVEYPGCICKDIISELDLSQATISQHLKVLKETNLIQGEIDGPTVCYCIRPNIWADMQKLFTRFFETTISKSDCC